MEKEVMIMMVKDIKAIKKQPEAGKKPQIKSGTTACSCGCKPPPRKGK